MSESVCYRFTNTCVCTPSAFTVNRNRSSERFEAPRVSTIEPRRLIVSESLPVSQRRQFRRAIRRSSTTWKRISGWNSRDSREESFLHWPGAKRNRKSEERRCTTFRESIIAKLIEHLSKYDNRSLFKWNFYVRAIKTCQFLSYERYRIDTIVAFFFPKRQYLFILLRRLKKLNRKNIYLLNLIVTSFFPLKQLARGVAALNYLKM